MQNVPGLNGIQSPFERFKRFASMILAVPKDEAEKENSAKGKKRESRQRKQGSQNGRENQKG